MSHAASIISSRAMGAPRRYQSGAFLLEALIGILIFSFGVLGLVGLQAKSIRNTADANARAEAIYLANSVIGLMWSDNIAALPGKYASTPGTGTGYTQFKTKVSTTLPQVALAGDPTIEFNPPLPLPQPPSQQSTVVVVTVHWLLPGELVASAHQHQAVAIIGKN